MTRRRQTRRAYKVTVTRDIEFRHEIKVYAASEEQAEELARERGRQGDWFGGDVVNDWIKSSVAPWVRPARKVRKS